MVLLVRIFDVQARIQSGVRGVNAHPGGGPCVMQQVPTLWLVVCTLLCAHFGVYTCRGTVFGGVKQSGLDVEGGGDIGLKEFTDITTLRIAKKGL